MAEAPGTGVRPGAVALLQDLGDGPVPGADVGRSSYLMAAVMLVSTTLHPALLLVFPGWVALAGLIVLARTGRSGVRTSPRSRP